MFPGSYVLYGSSRSFFTAKVENALRYLELPYELVEKQPHDGSEIEKRAGSGALPVMQTPEDWVLWDSTPILAMLDGRFPERRILPETPVQRMAALLLEDWIDEWFTRPAMYTRWNFDESVEAVLGGGAARALFGKSYFELDEGELAKVRQMIAGAAPFRKHMTENVANVVGSTLEKGKDIPVWFESVMRDFEAHFARHPFLLGSRPCVADFALNGGFAAHFAYDPWPKRFLEERAPGMLAWSERCWNATYDSTGGGAWIGGDAIPETWEPLFAEVEDRFLRWLLANREALGAGAKTVEVDLGFGAVEMGVIPYRERSRLDVRDSLLSLSSEVRKEVAYAIPESILEAYLLPPLVVPGPTDRKGLFPPRED